MRTHRDRAQLSLDVKQDTRLDGSRLNGENPVVLGEIALSGAVRVRHNLHPGEEVIVTVTNADGEVIAGGEFVIETPSFPPIKDKGVVIGTKRRVKLSQETDYLEGHWPSERDPRRDE